MAHAKVEVAAGKSVTLYVIADPDISVPPLVRATVTSNVPVVEAVTVNKNTVLIAAVTGVVRIFAPPVIVNVKSASCACVVPNTLIVQEIAVKGCITGVLQTNVDVELG